MAKYAAAIVIPLVALVTVLSGCSDTGGLPQPGGVIVGQWFAQRATGESVAAGVPGPVLPMIEAMSIPGGSGLVSEKFWLKNASDMHYEEKLGAELLFWWDAEYQVTSRQPVPAAEPGASAEEGIIVLTRLGKAGGTQWTAGDESGSATLIYRHLRTKRNSQWQDFLDVRFQLSDIVPQTRAADPRFTDQQITLTMTRQPLLEDPLPPPGLY